MVYDFKDSVKVGESGEEEIFDWLRNNPNVESVDDVRDMWEYRAKDVDAVVNFKDGSSGMSEIKTDTYTSGNFFFETMSSMETGSLGCLYKTQADYLMYYFVNFGELYIIKMSQFRKWFDKNKNRPEFKRKEVKNKRRNGGTYTTEGYTFPKSFMEKDFKAFKKVSI